MVVRHRTPPMHPPETPRHRFLSGYITRDYFIGLLTLCAGGIVKTLWSTISTGTQAISVQLDTGRQVSNGGLLAPPSVIVAVASVTL